MGNRFKGQPFTGDFNGRSFVGTCTDQGVLDAKFEDGTKFEFQFPFGEFDFQSTDSFNFKFSFSAKA